jgi:hypothetical protein
MTTEFPACSSCGKVPRYPPSEVSAGRYLCVTCAALGVVGFAGALAGLEAELATGRARVGSWAKLLLRYGDHDLKCSSHSDGGATCGCGWKDVAKTLRGEA